MEHLSKKFVTEWEVGLPMLDLHGQDQDRIPYLDQELQPLLRELTLSFQVRLR